MCVSLYCNLMRRFRRGKTQHIPYSVHSKHTATLEIKISIPSSDQCCGFKYIEFGSGSMILDQFGSGSGSRVIQSIFKEKIKNNFREK